MPLLAIFSAILHVLALVTTVVITVNSVFMRGIWSRPSGSTEYVERCMLVLLIAFEWRLLAVMVRSPRDCELVFYLYFIILTYYI
jgi:hypothetical protein